ncbi:MAG: hypothetical protein B6D47_07690 [Rhodocyclaceae bacterium UTPRO2]|jgi:O-antigen/teichoic acid export membrane protein|nr:MAG: hypothetical protein B6D47_07690 [Rhodocyclaceae bacterium UTPRO2]
MTRDLYGGPILKRAMWHFLTGKIASAALTFVILLWLVRLLPLSDYGAYVVLIANAELGYAIAALGLPWVSTRFIPEYRLNGSGLDLAKMCYRLVRWQVLALICLALLIWASLDIYLAWSGLLSQRNAALLALALLIVEGLARFEREGLLSPLMLQSENRSSLVVRQASLLALIAVLHFSGLGTLDMVIASECIAALLGLATAHFFLTRNLSELLHVESKTDWQAPDQAAQWRIAFRMHAARIITLASSPQVFLNIIQRTVGAEATALFGFLHNLYVQITNYLPATLFFTVFRPKLIADYVKGGMQPLAHSVNLLGKLSLFVLMLLILLTSIGGDLFVALLSGGKIEKGGALLLGLLVVLIPFSQRLLIETVAVTLERAGLCLFGSSLALFALPLMVWLLQMDFGLWSAVIAMLASQMVFNAAVINGISRDGYRADWVGSAKLVFTTFFAWVASDWIAGVGREHDSLRTGLACLIAIAAYLSVAWMIKPFTDSERKRINEMAGRCIFVW